MNEVLVNCLVKLAKEKLWLCQLTVHYDHRLGQRIAPTPQKKITFANSLDLDQDQQIVGPDLVPKCLTL